MAVEEEEQGVRVSEIKGSERSVVCMTREYHMRSLAVYEKHA